MRLGARGSAIFDNRGLLFLYKKKGKRRSSRVAVLSSV